MALQGRGPFCLTDQLHPFGPVTVGILAQVLQGKIEGIILTPLPKLPVRQYVEFADPVAVALGTLLGGDEQSAAAGGSGHLQLPDSPGGLPRR